MAQNFEIAPRRKPAGLEVAIVLALREGPYSAFAQTVSGYLRAYGARVALIAGDDGRTLGEHAAVLRRAAVAVFVPDPEDATSNGAFWWAAMLGFRFALRGPADSYGVHAESGIASMYTDWERAALERITHRPDELLSWLGGPNPEPAGLDFPEPSSPPPSTRPEWD